jgi:hypothetical protein
MTLIRTLFLLLLLYPAAARATDATVATTPANDCTAAAGTTCSVTVAYDKHDSAGTSFSLWLMSQNQDTGKINAPDPGVQLGCNTSGAGSITIKLPPNASYTFRLMSGPAPCLTMDILSRQRGNSWFQLASAYIYVHN